MLDQEDRLAARQTRQSGFTLAECIVAIAILGSSCLAGLMLFEVQTQVQDSLHLEATSLGYLKQEVEWTKSIPFPTLSDMEWTTIPEDARFAVSREVSDVNPEVKGVKVSIQWSTDSGGLRTESVSTLRHSGSD